MVLKLPFELKTVIVTSRSLFCIGLVLCHFGPLYFWARPRPIIPYMCWPYQVRWLPFRRDQRLVQKGWLSWKFFHYLVHCLEVVILECGRRELKWKKTKVERLEDGIWGKYEFDRRDKIGLWILSLYFKLILNPFHNWMDYLIPLISNTPNENFSSFFHFLSPSDVPSSRLAFSKSYQI